MKKFITAILMMLALSLSLFCLFGCSGDNDKIDGKYMFAGSLAQSGSGMMINLKEMNDEGKYVNVNHGEFLPENFWVEIKGKTMTVHGSISPTVAGTTVKFNVDSEDIHTIERFTLKTSTTNKNWYSIYDEQGEDTLYIVLKDGGTLVFKFNNPGDNFWYNISYNRA